MKKIFLGILMPFALLGSETQIKELKEARYNKELELSELGNKIAEKDKQIQSFRDDAMEFIAKKIKAKKLSKEEAIQEGQDIDDAMNNFYNYFLSISNDTKMLIGFFLRELFKTNQQNEFDQFEMLRFYVIRMINEINLLKSLVEKYEETQQELAQINNILNNIASLE